MSLRFTSLRVGHQVGNIIAITTRIAMKSRMLQNTIRMSRCAVVSSTPSPSSTPKDEICWNRSCSFV